MAYGLKVHQALHGYAEGHRSLGQSVRLKPRDVKTMLVLSDSAGAGGRVGEGGYLTGYPLPDSGYYALARTWSAPEMSRPGCVWTHSLLIDFTDLPKLGDPSELNVHFRRPIPSAYAEYERPLTVENFGAAALREEKASSAFAERVLAALYGRPGSRVIIEWPAEDVNVEEVVLTLWAQQWPRLRRGFRFCTLTSVDRSTDGSPFDLQVLPPRESGVRSRFADAFDADAAHEISAEDWLLRAISDLCRPGEGDLRQFLRQVGGDVTGGRHVFAALTRLHMKVCEFDKEPAAIEEAINLLSDDLRGVRARSARALVANRAARHIDRLSERTLSYLLMHIEFLAEDYVLEYAEAFGESLWSRNPALLLPMVASDGPSGVIASRTIASLPARTLIAGLARTPEFVPYALSLRPDIVTDRDYWLLDTSVRKEAFEASETSQERLSGAVSAMIESGRNDLAEEAANRFGASRLWAPLAAKMQTADSTGLGLLAPWIVAAARDPIHLAEVLAEGKLSSRRALIALARATTPDNVPNEYGEDPWMIAARNAVGEVDELEATFFAAYLLSRAMGSQSRSGAPMAAMSFDAVYSAAAANCIGDDGWRLLDQRLPHVSYWSGWDRCQRLRLGLTELFVGRDLSSSVFAEITSDDALFAALAETAAKSWRGRRYLRQVRSVMEDSDSERYARRIQAIAKLVTR